MAEADCKGLCLCRASWRQTLFAEPLGPKKRNAGQKLLNKCTAIKSGEFTDTAPAESPRSLQQSAPGSVVPENARPPVLSPDACQRPASRTSTRAVA